MRAGGDGDDGFTDLAPARSDMKNRTRRIATDEQCCLLFLEPS